MSNEDTGIRWEVKLREGSQIWMVGTRDDGHVYVWFWDYRSMFEGPMFVRGPLAPGEVPPRPPAEAMDKAEQIQRRLMSGDPTLEWPR